MRFRCLTSDSVIVPISTTFPDFRFELKKVTSYASHIFESGAVTSDFLENCKELFENLLDEIHDDAFVLTEGFQWPSSFLEDNYLFTREDGNLYENLMGWAKKYGMLNQIDVHHSMLEYIRDQKILQEKRSPAPKL